MADPGPESHPEPAVDPSMDDILASIRRILNEEEAPKAAHAELDDGVLELSPEMMVPGQPEHRLRRRLPGRSRGRL